MAGRALGLLILGIMSASIAVASSFIYALLTASIILGVSEIITITGLIITIISASWVWFVLANRWLNSINHI